MKPLIFILLASLACNTALTQSSVEGGQPHFRWSLRKAQDLYDKPSILRSTELTAEEKEALISEIANLIRPFMEDQGISSERELRSLAAGTRVWLVDLDGDGIPEIVAHAYGVKEGCGATGNCTLWVFKNTADGYKKLLDTREKDGIGGIEYVTVEDTRTNGFKDLVLASHVSVDEKALEVYRFRNERYRSESCYYAQWGSLTNEGYKQRSSPEISPSCPR